MDHAGGRQIPSLVINRNPGKTGRRRGKSVISAGARDYLLLFRLAPKIVVVADELVVRVVGVGTRAAEEYPTQMLGVGMLMQKTQNLSAKRIADSFEDEPNRWK